MTLSITPTLWIHLYRDQNDSSCGCVFCHFKSELKKMYKGFYQQANLREKDYGIITCTDQYGFLRYFSHVVCYFLNIFYSGYICCHLLYKTPLNSNTSY